MTRVRVHFHLRLRKFSVCTYVKGRGWIVDHHAEHVLIQDAKFKVSEAGRRRVLRERKKNVHAFIYGELVRSGEQYFASDLSVTALRQQRNIVNVKYNPYEFDSFVTVRDHKPVDEAKLVYCTVGERPSITCIDYKLGEER